MNFKIFRHYDIRGIINKDFEPKDTFEIGLAIGTFFKQHEPQLKKIFIGQDLRESSQECFNFLSSSFLTQGFDVVNVGICPTPAISTWVKQTSGAAGIMITASHNPNVYNGIKIYLNALGGQIWGQNIQEIAKYLPKNPENFFVAQKPGQLLQDELVKKNYLQILEQDFLVLKSYALKIGIDCLGGAAQGYVAQIVKKLNFQHVFFVDNSNKKIDQPDPTEEKNLTNLKNIIQKENLDIGVAFDGDADRVIFIDNFCNLIDGDKLNAIFFQVVLKQNPGAKIVVDVKTSDIVADIIKKNGGKYLESPTGNPLIQKMAQENNAIFCGEASCHFTFFDSGVKVDDGIYAWLRLLKHLFEENKTLAELNRALPTKSSTPEIILKYQDEAVAKQCIESVKNSMLFYSATLSNLDGLKARISNSWGLIRKSNTQPILSLRFEANNREDLKIIKKYFADALSGLVEKSELELLVD